MAASFPKLRGKGDEFHLRGMLCQFLDHFQGMVRGAVIHEDEFQGIGRQVFLENPVYFLLERRNGLFFIQAGTIREMRFMAMPGSYARTLSDASK